MGNNDLCLVCFDVSLVDLVVGVDDDVALVPQLSVCIASHIISFDSCIFDTVYLITLVVEVRNTLQQFFPVVAFQLHVSTLYKLSELKMLCLPLQLQS